MTYPGTPVPPPVNLSNTLLHNPTFIQHTQIIDQRQYIRSGERPGYARLLENVATAALHDSVHVVDPPKCYPNTRVAIIQNIIDWTVGKLAEELSGKPILWLKGGAGAGKSAIARSVAERCSDEGLLLGAFFFRAADRTRNHVEKLVATLSSQISVVLPEFRDTVAAFIEDDPLIFDRSIKTQFSTLIARPLSAILANRPAASTATPRLIILDGLDECSAINSQRDLLLALHEVTSTTTLIRFLICSRPESHLNNTFSLSHMVPILYKITLDDDYAASEDIRLFLKDKFKQIKEGHSFKRMLPDPWPMPGMVYDLVEKSLGQFIYADTVIRYIESPRHRPDQRLDAIFQLRPPFKDLPFTELDALYRLIISKAEDLPTVLDILSFPALYGLEQTKYIEVILRLEQGSVEVLLADLHSIVTISNGMYVSVRFLHKSLADFLSEPQRAGDLYRDLSGVQLSHVACVISIFSTHHGPQTGYVSCSLAPLRKVLSALQDSEPDDMKTDYVSSDILQASQQFPMFEFIKPFLLYSRVEQRDLIPPLHNDWSFLFTYLAYLYHIKDVCESTRLIYREQMQQYCESVLAVLDDNLSGDWNAHFIFAYCYLLHDLCYRLPRKLSHVNLFRELDSIYVGAFSGTILDFIGLGHKDSPFPYFDDTVNKIFHDLIGDTKNEAIIAKSASFCLALLCDERHASHDADCIFGIPKHIRRKKRDRPRRQMVPRLPSIGNRLVLIGFRENMYADYNLKLTRIRKALRNSMPYRYENTRIITMKEYFEIQSEPVRKIWPESLRHKRPQQWPLFIFFLEMLPHILPLAGRYDPLLDMCRKKCLSSFSQFWPKKSRRARQAIDSYLRKMDESQAEGI
ncbi:hypothetical protein CPC08DRAFT_226653 [Agrocybe pediades]|nr:hypothetical protein CPC08DRAFT_226653 [Agrocybe pediades]